jgi:hypothetical protein
MATVVDLNSFVCGCGGYRKANRHDSEQLAAGHAPNAFGRALAPDPCHRLIVQCRNFQKMSKFFTAYGAGEFSRLKKQSLGISARFLRARRRNPRSTSKIAAIR